jgi:hypothetical protein
VAAGAFTRARHVSTALTHLVFTRAASGDAAFYVNGVDRAMSRRGPKAELTPFPGRIEGDFSNWIEGCRLVLGRGRPEEEHPPHVWQGDYFRVAVYSRALGADEVRARYERGGAQRQGAIAGISHKKRIGGVRFR